MSLIPDITKESKLIIPANTQKELTILLKEIFSQHPHLGKFIGSRTTLWENRFEITPEGAEYLVKLIKENPPVQKLQSDILHKIFEETRDWPTEQILTQPSAQICACMGSANDLQKELNLCNCAFKRFVYNHRHELVEYRRQNEIY